MYRPSVDQQRFVDAEAAIAPLTEAVETARGAYQLAVLRPYDVRAACKRIGSAYVAMSKQLTLSGETFFRGQPIPTALLSDLAPNTVENLLAGRRIEKLVTRLGAPIA